MAEKCHLTHQKNGGVPTFILICHRHHIVHFPWRKTKPNILSLEREPEGAHWLCEARSMAVRKGRREWIFRHHCCAGGGWAVVWDTIHLWWGLLALYQDKTALLPLQRCKCVTQWKIQLDKFVYGFVGGWLGG